MDLHEIRQIGVAAAFQGGRQLTSFFGKIHHIHKKGAIDLVTQADIESEKIIIDIIRRRCPDHAILAEESGSIEGNAEARWIIDPLDGTTNFAHGIGIFAVSIAFSFQDQLCVGIVFNPVSQELFTGIRGQGAYLNNRKITVSSCSPLSDSLLVTGFPYSFKEHLNPLMQRFTRCLIKAQGVRRLGSAAIDLCYVACGRFEGFWEENLKPWDTAAGVVIAREAGARISDFSNNTFSLDHHQILATNGLIHDEMLELLEE